MSLLLLLFIKVGIVMCKGNNNIITEACVCAKHEIKWTLSAVVVDVVSISTTGLSHDNARQQRNSCYKWPRNRGHESRDDTEYGDMSNFRDRILIILGQIWRAVCVCALFRF